MPRSKDFFDNPLFEAYYSLFIVNIEYDKKSTTEVALIYEDIITIEKPTNSQVIIFI